MKKFEELDKRNINEIEEETLKSWEDENLLNETIENRKNDENFVFYDGPATANGMPGVHHMLAKVVKDTFCKYKTMKGYKVIRKVGWDTHGLPVEVQVEKELGISLKDLRTKIRNCKLLNPQTNSKKEENTEKEVHCL